MALKIVQDQESIENFNFQHFCRIVQYAVKSIDLCNHRDSIEWANTDC